jgi:SAM-dependent methyltransferase
MDNYQHEVLRTLALSHNYNAWIVDIFRPNIGKNILEVGPGIGNLTYYLEKLGKLACLDKSSSFLKHLQIDHPGVECVEADITDPSIMVLKKNNFDTVVCVNVLEHIEQDKKALKNMHELLVPGGKLLLFVPALPLLYGSMDSHLDHFRRYSKKDLLGKLKEAGFSVEEVKYNNFIAAFGWFLNSRILRKKQFPILQPLFFDKMVPLIRFVEKIVKIPFGMNLTVIAKKRFG